ncbi:hypothetical protein RFI_22174 [Reticulomyxa filosa]|uniref:GOLD domain-containing protein n=1 Tax=Reticulomyxa filosa TaxID=46433 RepID=X6MMU1_RETFI|nr:hypothetical protein RFI_22174 [Reticulomyxa filosa]|eukprot:ETO15189.1 hypothetical protein RFI_22174 [Reticulomyxa filosa]
MHKTNTCPTTKHMIELWIQTARIGSKMFHRRRYAKDMLPVNTLVVISYNSLDHQKLNGRSLELMIKDPFEKVILKTTLTEPSGKSAFTSEQQGDHLICFGILQGTKAEEFVLSFYFFICFVFSLAFVIRMEIHIDSGEQANDYEKLARVEHLSMRAVLKTLLQILSLNRGKQLIAVEVELRRLNDKIRAIRNEQAYQKVCDIYIKREEEFRDTSESTNSKIVWWSLINTAILVGCGLFQIWHLKRFFSAKKLV